MNASQKVFIIGGGPLGLGIAHELLKNGIPSIILEAGPGLLGLAATFERGEVNVEKFYHFFYKNDHFMSLEWLREYSDTEPKIDWQDITTDSVVSGARYNFDSILTIIRLSGRHVLSAGLTFVTLMFKEPNANLDSQSAEVWARKVFGPKLAEGVWLPLLAQKFGSRSKDVSALWLATRIKRHLSTKGKGIGRSRFGYLVDTYAPYVERFCSKLRSSGGNVVLGEPVSTLKFDKGKICKIITTNREIEVSDAVVFSSVPLANLRALMPDTNPIPLLDKFVNVSCVVCVLFLKKPLSSHYWTTVSDDSYPFAAIIQQNRLHAKSAEEIVYLSRYCESSDPLMSADDSALISEWLEAVKQIFPDFEFVDVLGAKVVRANNAAPVPYMGAMKDLAELSSPFDNFYFSGYENIFPEDRGVGNSISIGRELAKVYCKLLDD